MERLKKLIESERLSITLSLFLFSLLLSVLKITERPIHHDESLHLMYGAYPVLVKGLFYKYDPMLHGPFMYHVLYVLFSAFHPSVFFGRMLPAMLGSIISVAPMFFQKKLGTYNAFFITLLLIFSPTLTYWSRFLREDLVILTFQFCALYAAIKLSGSKKYLFAALFLVMQFTVKENSYLTMALLIGFATYSSFINFIIFKKLPHIKIRNILYGLCGIGIGVFIFTLIYTNLFTHPSGFLDGLYRKSLSYWFNQHKIERVGGPFIFQSLMLAWYELPLITFLFFQSVLFYIQRGFKYWTIPLISLLLSIALSYLFLNNPDSISFLIAFAKIKLWQDIFLFSFLITHAFISTTILLLEKKSTLAFFHYMFWAALFTYSFVGEKVPWLALYPFLYGIILIAISMKNYALNAQIGITIVFLCYQIPIMILTNYINNGSKNEFIAQVQTTKEYQTVLQQIKNDITDKSVYIDGTNTWPTTWFLFGYKNFDFKNERSLENHDYILLEEYRNNLYQKFTFQQIPMRHWWVPDYRQLTVFNFFKYSFTHIPWNSPGWQNIYFYSSRNFK